MTCHSQSEQCRGELFRPNEQSFASLHHSDFAKFLINYIGKERLTSCTLDIKLILIAIERY